MIELTTRISQIAGKGDIRDLQLWEAAKKLESSFLSEMLKSAGLGEMSESFGGGPGEEQFQSLLRGAQADLMVASGGIGLAQSIFEALKESDNVSV